MGEKNNIDREMLTGLMQQYHQMKSKHPDTVLLFSVGNTYKILSDDAVTAAEILGATLTRVVGDKEPHIDVVSFPDRALDTYLPKLVRAGKRVAICELLKDPIQQKQSNPNTESDVKKNESKNEEPEAKKAAEKTAKAEAKSKVKTEAKSAVKKEKKEAKEAKETKKTKAASKKASDKKVEAKAEDQKEKKATAKKASTKKATAKEAEIAHREPQLVTANGGKVTHAHFFQSNQDSSRWLFTAKIDGVQLRPRLAEVADIAKANEMAKAGEKFPVKEMMDKYYPSKMAQKVSAEEFALPVEIQGVNGKVHVVERLNPYKEKALDHPDMGKWKLFATIDGKNVSIAPSNDILSAYFDRSMPLSKIVEKAFGAKLSLPGAYEQYKKPEGLEEGKARVHKVSGDDKHWYVSVKLDSGLSTPAKPISFDDSGSYHNKAVSADQLADKYLSKEIATLLQKEASRQEVVSQKAGMKI